MSYYIPSDNPQVTSVGPGEGQRRHEECLRTYGPPPPNYVVARYWHIQIDPVTKERPKVMRMRYTETSSAGAQPSFDHPLSSVVQSPVIHSESLLVRKKAFGVFDAPITYRAGTEMAWRYSRSMGALANAMAMLGTKNKAGTGPITEADVRAAYENIPQQEKEARQNSVLYHPTDRDSMVWPDEPALAMVARTYGYSLIILSPFVSHNGIGYNRIYDLKDRPPIYARFSTGRTALHTPVVLGCLPEQVVRTDKSFRAMWFSVEPKNGQKLPDWFTDIYSKVDILALAGKIGFPVKNFKSEVFLWSLVSLQRRIVVGYELDDGHLACWIWQFGNHLVTNCLGWSNPHPTPFTYDATRISEYKGKFPNGHLTFMQLTRLILNPHMRSETIRIKEYASRWDEAIEAQITYTRNKTDTNWDNFTSKMAHARKLPF